VATEKLMEPEREYSGRKRANNQSPNEKT